MVNCSSIAVRIKELHTLEPVFEAGQTYFYDYNFWHEEIGISFKPKLEKTYKINLGFLEDRFTLERGIPKARIPNNFKTNKLLLKTYFVTII